jgi:hypothetical protein
MNTVVNAAAVGFGEGAVAMSELSGASVHDCTSHDFTRERHQVMHIIDRFFGTINGHLHSSVPGVDSCNIFGQLRDNRMMLCGGAINSVFTNREVNDLDFYMEDNSHQVNITKMFQSYGFEPAVTTLNAITFKRKSEKSSKVWTIQLITRFVGKPQEIFDWFDFTITHGCYQFSEGRFVLGNRFLPDLSKRKLVYSGSSQYPICAMYRTKKYVDRGYTLSGATIMHICLAIVQLKITNYKELKEQLMGIDTMYLRGLLESKEPTAPVNYGEFIYEAFKAIDAITGVTVAEEED